MPRIVRDDGQRGETWEPMFPDIARPTNRGTQREGELHGLNDSGDVPWTSAPSTSHLEGFRLFAADDPKQGRFLRRFLGGESTLMIRFKPSGTRGTTEYHYFFNDAKTARDVFDQLANADEPGKVVHTVLIGGRVRYKRVT